MTLTGDRSNLSKLSGRLTTIDSFQRKNNDSGRVEKFKMLVKKYCFNTRTFSFVNERIGADSSLRMIGVPTSANALAGVTVAKFETISRIAAKSILTMDDGRWTIDDG